MRDEAMTKLGESLRGTLIGRDHPDYEDARKLYNGMIDKRPLMIARCADVADVITAVNFGRDNELLVAIRGGGHNGPGLGSCDDGLVIDLSMMKGVRVDPAIRTVRVALAVPRAMSTRQPPVRASRPCRDRLDDRHCRPDSRGWDRLPHPNMA
jgi:hypothetical protein